MLFNIIIGTYKVGNKDFEDDIGIDGETFDSANVFLKSVWNFWLKEKINF